MAYEDKLAASGTSYESRKSIKERLEIHSLALAVKRKYLSLEPYRKTFGFSPSDAGKHTGTLTNKLRYTTEGFAPSIPAQNPVTVQEAEHPFLVLKKRLNRLVEIPGQKTERASTPFYSFLASFSQENMTCGALQVSMNAKQIPS
ncbi:MAG: uncharacterized protein A8A55_1467 [Amphiamblys sp. WSBS2006]|nr:MAG: uncharacterized protein A8A55_1467 [Amphiamblys sp. WSBS2006]